MENLSLYDLLVGFFPGQGDDSVIADDQYFDQLSEDKKLRQSIVENLSMVLKTRQGSVQHLPDFGFPDFMQVFLDSGGSIDPIRNQIRDVITKYEPRIEKASVTKTDFDEKNMRISLKIMASIKGSTNKEFLLTEFSTTGWTKVVFEKDLS